jgi:hypothetical protein
MSIHDRAPGDLLSFEIATRKAAGCHVRIAQQGEHVYTESHMSGMPRLLAQQEHGTRSGLYLTGLYLTHPVIRLDKYTR